MTILYIANSTFSGLSSDTKPTGVMTNSIFFETDTGHIYRWTGSAWTVINSATGGGFAAGGSSTQSGNASTVAFNIAHGLGTTPDIAHVVPTSADAIFSTFRVAKDATNLTITYNMAPPTGTNNLTWNWGAAMVTAAATTGFTPSSIHSLTNKTIDAVTGTNAIISPQFDFPYTIFKDGSNYKAINNVTGLVQFSNATAQTTFTSVIDAMNTAGGGLAFVKPATYDITAAIIMENNTGLIGENRDTVILRSQTNTSDNTVLRYWAGASSAPLSKFRLENLTILANDGMQTEMCWMSSGTEYLVVRNCYFKSNGSPSVAKILFFLDTAGNTNTNNYAIIEGNIFEGPTLGQDMLGCGDLNYSLIRGNRFHNGDGQGWGAANIEYTVFANNIFFKTGNIVGLESICNNNVIEGNIGVSAGGIKLSGSGNQDTHKSISNVCVGNALSYGNGSIEDGHGTHDVIANNTFYRTKKDGIYGAMEYCIIANNQFIETNYDWNNVTVGTDSASGRQGGVVLLNNTSWAGNRKSNRIHSNIFRDTGVSFTVPTGFTDSGASKSGLTGGIMIDTTFENTEVYDNSFLQTAEAGNKLRDHGISTRYWNNTGYVIETEGLKNAPSKKKIGFWIGNSVDTWTGLLADGINDTFSPVQTIALNAMDNTHGRSQRYTTANAAGNNGGWRVPTSFTNRGLNPRLKCKFKLVQTGSQRLMIGFRNDTAVPSADDDPLNAEAGIMLSVRSTDTTGAFQIGHNDTTGATVFDSITGSTIDTNVHTIEIIGDSYNNRFCYRFDNGNTKYISTDVPGATDTLGIMFAIQTSAAATKSLDGYYFEVETD